MKLYQIVCLLSCILLASGSKEACNKLSACKCQHSKGIVDLTSLSGKSFSVEASGVTYSFFPCEQGKELGSECSKSDDNAVCSQRENSGNGDKIESWGTESSAEFLVPDSTNYDITMVKFHASGRKVDVLLDCPKDGEGGEELDFLQVQGDNLQLRLKSQAACYEPHHPSTSPHTKVTPSPTTQTNRKPTGTAKPAKRTTAPAKPAKKATTPTSIPTQPPATFQFDLSKLGHWYALAGCLSFLSLCAISYVAVGTAYQRRNGAKGLGLVPNRRFWKSCCRLFVDGFLFTFSCFPACRNSIGVGTGGYVQIQDI